MLLHVTFFVVLSMIFLYFMLLDNFTSIFHEKDPDSTAQCASRHSRPKV